MGSISFPSYVFLQSNLNVKQKIWITLFDYIEDDEYDGDLGEDDEEKPRVQVEYKLTNSIQTSG